MAKKVKEVVEESINKTIEDLGYELVEVEYAKKIDGMNLTVYIDSDNGISIDDCEKVHKEIDPILDEVNPTDDEPYILSVSSPGLDRPLKTNRDLNRNIGKDIEIKLYAPIEKKKVFEGTLIGFNDTTIELQQNGGVVKLEREKIANIIPVLKF